MDKPRRRAPLPAGLLLAAEHGAAAATGALPPPGRWALKPLQRHQLFSLFFF